MMNRLYENALNDPARYEFIKDRLAEEVDSHKPITRIWTNKTLHLLQLIDLSHEIAEEEEPPEEEVKELLIFTSFKYFNEYVWAAQKSIEWLEEQH